MSILNSASALVAGVAIVASPGTDRGTDTAPEVKTTETVAAPATPEIDINALLEQTGADVNRLFEVDTEKTPKTPTEIATDITSKMNLLVEKGVISSSFTAEPGSASTIKLTQTDPAGNSREFILSSEQAGKLGDLLKEIYSAKSDYNQAAAYLTEHIRQAPESKLTQAQIDTLKQIANDPSHSQNEQSQKGLKKLAGMKGAVNIAALLKEAGTATASQAESAEATSGPGTPGGLGRGDVSSKPEDSEIALARVELARLRNLRNGGSEQQQRAAATTQSSPPDQIMRDLDRGVMRANAGVQTEVLHETYQRLSGDISIQHERLYNIYTVATPGFRQYSLKANEHPDFERGLLNVLNYTERSLELNPVGRVEVNSAANIESMSRSELMRLLVDLEHARFEMLGREVVYTNLEGGLLGSNRRQRDPARSRHPQPTQQPEGSALDVDDKRFLDIANSARQNLPRLIQNEINRGQGAFSFERRATFQAQHSQYGERQMENAIRRAGQEVERELARALRTQQGIVNKIHRDHSYDLLSHVTKKVSEVVDGIPSEAGELRKGILEAVSWDLEGITFRALNEGVEAASPKTIIDQNFRSKLGQLFDPRLSGMTEDELRMEAALVMGYLQNSAGLLSERETRIAELSLREPQIDQVIALEQLGAREALNRSGFTRHAVDYTLNSGQRIGSAEEALVILQDTAYMLTRINQELEQQSKNYDHWASANRKALGRRAGESASEGIRRIPQRVGRTVTDRIGDIINDGIDKVLKK